MDTADRRKQVLRKLTRTRNDETVCLMYWEVAILLDYIDELRRGRRNEKVQAADCKSTAQGNGRW